MRTIVTLFAFMVYESSCPVPLLFIWRTLSQPFQEETFPSPPLSAFGEIFTQHWKVSVAKNIREKTSRAKCNQELGVVKNILWSRLITYEYVKNMFLSTIPAEHDFRLIDFAKISNLIGNLFRVRNVQTWNSLKQIDRQISLLLYLCHENSLEKNQFEKPWKISSLRNSKIFNHFHRFSIKDDAEHRKKNQNKNLRWIKIDWWVNFPWKFVNQYCEGYIELHQLII